MYGKITSNTICLILVLLWPLFIYEYAQLLQANQHPDLAKELVYITQIIADVLIGIISLLTYLCRKNRFEKLFFLLLFVSIIIGLISTEAYNLIINLFGLSIKGQWVDYTWMLPYTLFLFIQVIAWPILFFSKRKIGHASKKQWLTKLPYTNAALMVIFSIFFSRIFKSSTFDNGMKILQALNSCLEMLLFVGVSLCLAHAKNKSFSLLASGFLLLITFNLAHRITYMSHFNGKLFNRHGSFQGNTYLLQKRRANIDWGGQFC